MDNNEQRNNFSLDSFLSENLSEEEVVEYSELLIEFLEIMYED